MEKKQHRYAIDARLVEDHNVVWFHDNVPGIVASEWQETSEFFRHDRPVHREWIIPQSPPNLPTRHHVPPVSDTAIKTLIDSLNEFSASAVWPIKKPSPRQLSLDLDV